MSSGRNGKKIPDLPARAKMLKFLYMDGELPETDSIINMFCGQSVSLDLPATFLPLKFREPVPLFHLSTR